MKSVSRESLNTKHEDDCSEYGSSSLINDDAPQNVEDL